MAIPVNSLLEIRLNVKTNDQLSTNVLHYVLESDFAGLTLEQEYDAIWEQLGGATPSNYLVQAFTNCLSLDAIWDSVVLQYVKPIRYVGKSYFPSFSTSQTGGCNAQNLSAVISKRSARAGKSWRGSIHLPAVPDIQLDKGNLKPAYLATMGILATELTQRIVDPLGGGELQPIIYTRKNTQFPWGDDVMQGVPQTTLRVMRSRTKGVGK